MAIITTERTNVDVGAPLRELAVSASISGSTITYTGTKNHYIIDDEFLDPANANGILQVPGTIITDYKLIRFISTPTLDADLPTSLPDSSITDEEGNTRQLTFREVDDRPTRSIPQYSDGLYYCKATNHTDCRGLTLDEYNACVSDGLPLLLTSDLPIQSLE
tara:strand:- start:3680 stop:4165 length:486 start_codon:yes stop_codon:yes gene_type:complete